MLSSRSLLLSLVLLSYFAVSSVCGAWSQLESDAAPSLVIDASKPLVNVSADLWGIFFEEINHAGVGGLHAERIQNSGFETMLNTYAPWAASASNAAAASVNLSLSQSMPLTWQSPTSLRVDSSATTKATTVGIDNPGFWGISIAGVNAFNVSLFAASTTITSVTVSLTSRDGSMVYGSTTLKGITARWTKLSGIVAVSGHDSAAIFTIQWTTSTRTASIYFDVISCIPVEGWRGLPYIRPDLAEHIAALHPSFVRFPGGCYVEGDSLTDRFNWKKALGPQEERRGHWNLWNYYSEDQLGLFEYLQFIERLTDAYGNPTRTVWVVSSGDSHTSHLRPDQLGPWIDEALDSIEFAVGDATQSEWGRLRAAMGHPQPFHIDYIAIGNEGNFYADQYKANYRVLYAAIHSAYPHIPLIANGYWTDVPIEVYDYHVYQTSSWFFDNQHTFDQYHRNVQIFNSEYAVTTGAGRGNLDAALGEAVWMTGLERNSDLVVLASYAPLLVNDNDQTWNPDAIVFNSSFSYGTPSYWTQLLYSNSYSGLVSGTVQTLTYQLSNTNNISVAVSVGQMSAEECSKQDMAASSSAYVHKIINYAATSQNITIRLDNLPSGSTLKPALEVTILTTAGDSNMDENTFLQPMLVAPVRMSVVVDGPQFTLSLPRWSIAVARAYVSARVQQHVSATLLS